MSSEGRKQRMKRRKEKSRMMKERKKLKREENHSRWCEKEKEK
jgi:hypothetical protein